MKAPLTKMLSSLNDLLSRAEIYAGSDNEITADRYNDVASALPDAIAAIEEAIAAFDN